MNLGERKRRSKKKKAIPWTSEQKDIISCRDSAVTINAYAGSGKSSTLMGVAEKYTNGLYLAFNKAIVSDIQDKLPRGWKAATFNSLGLGICIKNIGRMPKINFHKYPTLCEKHMSIGGVNTEESWNNTCKRFGVAPVNIDHSREILEHGLNDFTEVSGGDMLQMPIHHGWSALNGYNIILIDEYQDMNAQQMMFIKLIPTEKIVFCGDINQQIYGFRGADNEIVSKTKIYKPTEMNITQTFRCPEAIVNEVSGYLPNFSSAKKGGKVFDSGMNIKDIHTEDDALIISRTNIELIRLSYYYIQNWVDFSVSAKLPQKLRTKLTDLVGKVGSNRIDILDRISIERDALEAHAKLYGWGQNPDIEILDCIETILKKFSSYQTAMQFLMTLIYKANASSGRKLLTAFSAKGLESKNVYMLNNAVFESFVSNSKTAFDERQEKNLIYVAKTRSSENLHYARI